MSHEPSLFRLFRLVAAAPLALARRFKKWLRRLRPEDQSRWSRDGQDWSRSTSSESSVDAPQIENTSPTFTPPRELPPLDEMLRFADEAHAPPMAYRMIGFGLSQAGRLDEAERAYRKAIDVGDLGANSNLGTVLAKTGRIAEALEAYRAALTANVEGAHFNLGTLLFKEGRLTEAESHLRMAAAEGDKKAPLNLGTVLRQQGRVDEAIEMYRQAIAVGDTEGYEALGGLLVQERRLQEATEVYQSAINAGDNRRHFENGAVLWMQGDYCRAEEEYRAAIDAGDQRAYYALGVLLDELGRPQEAIVAFRRAQALGDTSAAEQLEHVERKERERIAEGRQPSGYAVPAPWKVALLSEIGESGLADHMQRWLDEAEQETQDPNRGIQPIESFAHISRSCHANLTIGHDQAQLSPMFGSSELRPVHVFVSSTFRDMRVERNELAKKVFPHLSKLCAKRGVVWGAVDLRWGVTDMQQLAGEVLPICLARIDECRPFFMGVLGERYGIQQEHLPPELIEREPWLLQHAGCSITELEILHGVLNDPERASHALFYFRDPAYVDKLPADQRADFVEDLIEEEVVKYGSKEAARRADARRQRLASLKQRIRSSGVATREYSNASEFGELVLADLTAIIEHAYPGEESNDLEREALHHDAFAQTRNVIYIPRQAYNHRLDEHAKTGGPPLIVTGGQGAGKSALLAHWSSIYRARNSTDLVLTHFVGATPLSSDWEAMLRRLIGELQRHCGIEEKIPEGPDALRGAFAKSLHMVAVPSRVVLLIDGLNQLDDRDAARELMWLPRDLPPTIRLVLSTLPGKALDELENRGWPRMEVEPLTANEREQLIVRYLMQLYGKTLDPSLIAHLTAAPQATNPLFLRAILEEMHIHGDRDTLHRRMIDYLEASNVPELYGKILERYEQDYDHERPGLVRDSMRYLWAARRGLSEAELLELLGTQGEPLPQAYWSPLYVAADRLLMTRTALISFFHESLRQAVQKRYIDTDQQKRELHLTLANYFGQREIDHRKLDELPWQLSKANAWERLAHLLRDVQFFNAAFDQNQFDVRTFWAEIEAQSPYRLMETYGPILGTVDTGAAWNLATLFEYTGHMAEAAALTRQIVLHYARSARAQIEPARHTAISVGADFKTALDDLDFLQAALHRYAANPQPQDADDGETDIQPHKEKRVKALVLAYYLQAALSKYASILLAQHKYDEVMRLLAPKEGICKVLGLEDGIQESLRIRASILNDRGEPLKAMELLKQQEKICCRIGDTTGLYTSLGNQARALELLGKLDEAIRLHKEVEYRCRGIGDMDGLKVSLGCQAFILYSQGNLEGAMALYREEESICRRIGDWEGVATSLADQALILRAHGELAAAMTALKKTELMRRESGNRAGLMASLGNQALILLDLGDLDGAMSLQKDAERLARELGSKDALQNVLGAQGVVLRMRGDLDGAMYLFDEREEICRETGNKSGIMAVLINKGVACECRGDLDRAMRFFREAETLSTELKENNALVKSLAGQARILEAQVDLAGAIILNHQASEICRETGNRSVLRLVLQRQAEIYHRQGDLEKAMELYEEHARVCRYLGLTKAH